MYFNQDTIRDTNLIKTVLRESGLSFLTEEIIHLPGGSKSFAMQIGNHVVRFPKSESVHQSLRREALISKILQKNLSAEQRGKTANIRCYDNVSYPFSRHKIIKGKICDYIRGETEYNTCYENLSAAQKNLLADDIAVFLTELHTIKETVKNPLSENWDFFQRKDFDHNACRNILLKYSGGQIDLKDFRSDFSSSDIVFAHNDMSGSNLIINETFPRVLQGIIDFGNAGLMPRLNEFFPYYKIHRNLARRVITHYNRKNDGIINQTAADYMALGCLGYFMNKSEKQNKPPPSALLKILENFIDDFYQSKSAAASLPYKR